MRHRLLVVALLPVISLLAACGNSSSSSTTSTTPATPTSSTFSTASTSASGTATASGTPKSSAGSSASSASTNGSASGTTRPTGGASPSGGSRSSGGGSVNARVPAAFSIHPGGTLTPPTVSAPAFLAVAVTIDSKDGASHQIVLRTPTPHTLTVAARGHASLLIPGLRAGAYAVDIDGAARGSLLIGGEPGP